MADTFHKRNLSLFEILSKNSLHLVKKIANVLSSFTKPMNTPQFQFEYQHFPLQLKMEIFPFHCMQLRILHAD